MEKLSIIRHRFLEETHKLPKHNGITAIDECFEVFLNDSQYRKKVSLFYKKDICLKLSEETRIVALFIKYFPDGLGHPILKSFRLDECGVPVDCRPIKN